MHRWSPLNDRQLALLTRNAREQIAEQGDGARFLRGLLRYQPVVARWNSQVAKPLRHQCARAALLTESCAALSRGVLNLRPRGRRGTVRVKSVRPPHLGLVVGKLAGIGGSLVEDLSVLLVPGLVSHPR